MEQPTCMSELERVVLFEQEDLPDRHYELNENSRKSKKLNKRNWGKYFIHYRYHANKILQL